MKKCARSLALVLLTAGVAALSACPSEPIESSGQALISGPLAGRLPPGHPGEVSGSTLFYPAYPDFPTIHYANCFAGVENEGEIGIGTAAGYKNYMGSEILPVNANLGAAELKSYQITIKSSDPAAVELQPDSVAGSYHWLSSDNCGDRCTLVCVDYPEDYQHQFNRAPGFEEDKPTLVAGDSTSITISAEDKDDGTGGPTTGVVNLANVSIRIVGDLPPGGVKLTFSVDSLRNSVDQDISDSAIECSGMVIQHFKLQ